MSAPDLIEPFVGWKGLHVNQDGQLFSPLGAEWLPGAPLEARCNVNQEHEPPVRGCSCGIYAVKTFQALRSAGYNWSAEYYSQEHGDCIAVVAEVKLWGRIRTGAIGYRAQFAYPAKVYVPAWRLSLGGVIKRRYGCAVRTIDRFTGERG